MKQKLWKLNSPVRFDRAGWMHGIGRAMVVHVYDCLTNGPITGSIINGMGNVGLVQSIV